jgi:hypothetical protein
MHATSGHAAAGVLRQGWRRNGIAAPSTVAERQSKNLLFMT